MSDTEDAEYGARGAVPVAAHMDTDNPVGGGDRPVDSRAAFLMQERQVQNQFASAIADPTGSILLSEIQDIRNQLSVMGTAVVVGIWLVGMAVGYAGYQYFKDKEQI